MRHVEQEAVAIDTVTELRLMVAVPSENDITVVFGVEGGFQVVGCLAGVHVAATVVQGAQNACFQSRRRAFVLVNNLVFSVPDLEGKVGDVGVGCCPIEVVVAQGHLESLDGGRGLVGGQEVDVRTSGVLHGDAATVPALHTVGGHNDFPVAIGTKNSLGEGRTAIIVSADGQNRVFKLVEERHFVVVGHGLTGLHVLNLLNDKTVALDNNLVDGGQGLPCHGFGGIGPTEVPDARHIAVDAHAEVFGCLGHLVVDIVGNEVVNDGLAACVVEMLAINEDESIRGTAPTPVEVEKVVGIVAVANESVATVGALA